MPHSASAQLAIAFLRCVCGLAMWRGRTPERVVAVGAVLNEILYLAFYHPNDRINPQWEAVIWDLIYVTQLGYAAIWGNRTWAKWAMAFELLIIGTHLALAGDLRIETYFAFWATAFWTIAVLLALIFGTLKIIWEERRAKRAALV
ncbi:MAG: hypothetical protein JWO33_1724, partial [Caulobacteraceae bacterium]|nr:hypothetical protein [Caulobacteraceae bacterium]